MKISLKRTSPNYRQKLSTQQMMKELTMAIIALSVLAIGYNFTRGSDYGIHAIMIFAISIVTAALTEFVFAKVSHKENAMKSFKNSFPLVTPIIFALTLPVGTPYFVVAIGSFIATFFGKLVYGGFGQNIFNPALVGRVVVHLSFGAQLTTSLSAVDAATAATPLTMLNSTNFLGNLDLSLSQLFIGMYPGALGETFTLAIFILGAILVWRKVIDYRIPVAYFVTAFVIAFVQGMVGGLNPLTNALTHIALGGIAFGIVFMATDPVTSPTSPLGKVIYGIGLGFMTMLIRYKSNYPEGCLFAILIMNMLVPLIDNLTLGRTNQKMVKQWAIIAVLFVFSVGTIAAITSTFELPVKEEEKPTEPAKKYEVISKNGNVYVVAGKGFGGNVELEVTFDGDRIASVKALKYSGETEGYGKDLIDVGNGGQLKPAAQAFHDMIFNSSFTKAELDGVDTSTGATITTNAIVNAIQGAIEEKQNDPIVSVNGNVYTVRSQGFNASNKMVLEVTLDKANRQVVSVKALEYAGETDGFGKNLIEAGNGGSLTPNAQGFFDKVFNSSFSYDEVDGIDTSTGATLTSKGIISGIKQAIEAYDAVLEKSPDGVYTITTKGFSGELVVEVKVNGNTIEYVKPLEYAGETAGFGKDLIEVGHGGSLKPNAQTFFDKVLNSSFNYDELSGVDTSTGATLTTQGIVDAVNKAVAADHQ